MKTESSHRGQRKLFLQSLAKLCPSLREGLKKGGVGGKGLRARFPAQLQFRSAVCDLRQILAHPSLGLSFPFWQGGWSGLDGSLFLIAALPHSAQQGGRGRGADTGGSRHEALEFLWTCLNLLPPPSKEAFSRASCLECGGRAPSVWAGLRAKNTVAKALDIFLLMLEI